MPTHKPTKTDRIITALRKGKRPSRVYSRSAVAYAKGVMDKPRVMGRPKKAVTVKELSSWLLRAWPLLERVVDARRHGSHYELLEACLAWDEWEQRNPRPRER